jgi:hypothetical protein
MKIEIIVRYLSLCLRVSVVKMVLVPAFQDHWKRKKEQEARHVTVHGSNRVV